MTPAELTDAGGIVALLLSSVGVPLYLNRRKERATHTVQVEKDDANLRDDQREFIAVLQKENATWRREVESLRQTVEHLREEIEQLRAELAAERRQRAESEARMDAETRTRVQLATRRDPRAGDAADEQRITEAGRAAEQREARRQDSAE